MNTRSLILLFSAALLLPQAAAAERRIDNALLVGWDGAMRQRVVELLKAGELPNLSRLIAAGGMTDTMVTTGATETKSGWAEILTGRSADGLGIEDNLAYRPIPEGLTVFALLKKRIPGIKTVFLAGKENNVSFRGPHEICINCATRQPPDFRKTRYWDRETILPETRTFGNLPRRWVKREGETFFHAVADLDIHANALNKADNVGKEALAALERCRGSRFFAFFQFEEPDEQGHLYAEGSPEYLDGIRAADRWLGRLLEKLESLGVRKKTAVFVVSDHGFNPGRRGHSLSSQSLTVRGDETVLPDVKISHSPAADTFLAADMARPLRRGDRKDVTPTILDALGIPPAGIEPPLDGRSLFATP
jgi:predicted AlkP superfamily pyrophosphatase or phosphodiesterase